jgi:hypothetical protein
VSYVTLDAGPVELAPVNFSRYTHHAISVAMRVILILCMVMSVAVMAMTMMRGLMRMAVMMIVCNGITTVTAITICRRTVTGVIVMRAMPVQQYMK